MQNGDGILTLDDPSRVSELYGVDLAPAKARNVLINVVGLTGPEADSELRAEAQAQETWTCVGTLTPGLICYRLCTGGKRPRYHILIAREESIRAPLSLEGVAAFLNFDLTSGPLQLCPVTGLKRRAIVGGENGPAAVDTIEHVTSPLAPHRPLYGRVKDHGDWHVYLAIAE